MGKTNSNKRKRLSPLVEEIMRMKKTLNTIIFTWLQDDVLGSHLNEYYLSVKDKYKRTDFAIAIKYYLIKMCIDYTHYDIDKNLMDEVSKVLDDGFQKMKMQNVEKSELTIPAISS